MINTMDNFKISIEEFKKNLDLITLKDLVNSPDVQENLLNIAVAINDYLRLINPKFRPVIIPEGKQWRA